MPIEDIAPLIPVELEEELSVCTNLPTLPAVALKIIDASKNPDISLHEVTSIISSDPALAVKLLKIGNSPLYSQRRTLNNLREALTLLGFNASLTIALSFTLLQSLGGEKNHEDYWKRSLLSASIARMLGVKLHVTRLEDLFLASLLQDIGILVLQSKKNSIYPEGVGKLMHSDRIKLEEQHLGVEHSQVGAWLLKSWNLPEYLINSVLHSHALNTKLPNQSKDESYFHYCVNLSGTLADIWLTDNPGELLLSNLAVTKKILDISNDELNDMIVDIDASLPEISTMFEILLVGGADRQKVISDAKELLLERSLHTIKQSEDDRQQIDNITDKVEKIEEESRLDHLTGAYNRQHIDNLLEVEYKESSTNFWPLSLAFIDVDNFKSINDVYGHLAGDEVLKNISGFFLKNTRQTDHIARYGGDEFLLMLPGATSEVAENLITRLLAIFEDEVKTRVKNEDISVSVSIGIATHVGKHNFDSLKGLMDAADKALYKAKAEGKNCYSVY